jgi:hypothetical protein
VRLEEPVRPAPAGLLDRVQLRGLLLRYGGHRAAPGVMLRNIAPTCS